MSSGVCFLNKHKNYKSFKIGIHDDSVWSFPLLRILYRIILYHTAIHSQLPLCFSVRCCQEITIDKLKIDLKKKVLKISHHLFSRRE